MANAKDFITRLAKAAGIPETNQDLQNIVNSTEPLEKIEVSPVFENVINTNLMTIDAAKNNSTLLDHFKNSFYAQHMAGIDAIVLEKAKAAEFSDEEVNELKAIDKTGKRISSLIEKLQSKAGSKDKTDGAELKKKISELHEQLQKQESEFTQKLSSEKTNFVNSLKNTSLDSLLSQHQYGVDLPMEVIHETVKNLINRKLTDKKYRHEYDAQSNKHSLKTEDGLDAYDGHTPVSFNDFLTSVLAENKLLKVSGGPVAQPAQIQTTQTTGDKKTFDTSLMEEQLKAFQ